MRFAVKVLSRSDLTFFEPQFRQQNAGNQKSINLNRDVFVDELFPAFPELLSSQGGQFGVRLQIEGPGLHRERIDVRRKLAKGGTYKNYRLNGEFVRNPDGDGARFNGLQPGDLAVMAFSGAAAPELIRLFVLSTSEPADSTVHAALSPGRGTMVSLAADELAGAIALAPDEHPLHDLLLDPGDAADLEEAAQGDASAVGRLLRAPARRAISAADLAEARRRAEETGREGEMLVACHFAQRPGDVIGSSWTSDANAISPWDFDLETRAGMSRVEVKTTRGAHGAPFHISMAEVQAATGPVPYLLYRVSELNGEGAALRISSDLPRLAVDLIAALGALPPGVRPDGFSIDPAQLSWTAPQRLVWPDEEP